jgi:hypothetical protein
MMKKFFIVFIFLCLQVYAYTIKNILHGFSVNIPDNYIIKASSKTGKIIIQDITGKKAISIFVLKNSK